MRAAGYLKADWDLATGDVKLSAKFNRQTADAKRAILKDWIHGLEAAYNESVAKVQENASEAIIPMPETEEAPAQVEEPAS